MNTRNYGAQNQNTTFNYGKMKGDWNFGYQKQKKITLKQSCLSHTYDKGAPNQAKCFGRPLSAAIISNNLKLITKLPAINRFTFKMR